MNFPFKYISTYLFKSLTFFPSMGFKAKKVYGSSKQLTCPFCGKTATQKNEQGLDVCPLHIKKSMDEFKCTCGSWLELRKGKFGPYFNCMNCGNINYGRAMEMKSLTKVETFEPTKKIETKVTPKEITVSSNDPLYFD
jgi:hypothetical protein